MNASQAKEEMTQAAEVKETKAQRAERLKREKNPWEAFNEVRAFARAGRSSVVPEWANMYFKWWGIYTQGDGVGAVGGKGGEGVASDYFMMRIGIPNGIVSGSQLRAIGGITRKYARNLADITVRQNIQLHWLTIEDCGRPGLDWPLAEGRLRRCGAQRDWLPAGWRCRR
jgi:sulfite reductase (ferredoxin)